MRPLRFVFYLDDVIRLFFNRKLFYLIGNNSYNKNAISTSMVYINSRVVLVVFNFFLAIISEFTVRELFGLQ